MIRRITLWAAFGIFSLGCVVWLGVLVMNASKSESVRWGAKKIRAEQARQGKGPIVIGVAGGWKSTYRSLLNGINLACDELNQGGGILGRPIKLVVRDDQQSVATGMRIAQEFADTREMVAVIGHPNSSVSLATTVSYEYYGLLMLSPLASSPALTGQNHQLIFRNIPTDEADGVALAEHAAQQGHRRVAIYYLQDDYSRNLANIFERRCGELGIAIVDRLPHDSTYTPSDFDADFALWRKHFSFDTILVAGLLPQAAEVITRIRQEGIDVPLLSGGSLDNENLIRLAGEAAEGVTVVSTFDPEAPFPPTAPFVKAYAARYGSIPDRNAAQGYDALHLLAHAIRQGRSTVPEDMAAALRAVKGWQGVTGPHTFDDKGDVLGKTMVMKKVTHGRFLVVR